MAFNKRGLLDEFDEQEIERYKQLSFLGSDNPNAYDPYSLIRKIYIVTFILYNIIFFIALILFYKLRYSYIIRQRNFLLTFIGGIITYLYGFSSFLSVIKLPVIRSMPCFINIYIVNFLNIVMMHFFFSRSLRVILSYRFNIYKVTSLKKSKMKEMYYGEKEPNNYLPKIYKKIKLLIALFIIIPSLVALLWEMSIHVKNYDICPLFKFKDEGNDSIVGMKMGIFESRKNQKFIQNYDQSFDQSYDQNYGKSNGQNDEQNNGQNYGKSNGQNYDQRSEKRKSKGDFYNVIQNFGKYYIAISLIIAVAMLYVKDANKYGVKFECMSTAIMSGITTIVNGLLNMYIRKGGRIKIFLQLFDITNGGKFLYIIVAIYILFASIVLPLIHYYKAKTEKNKYFQEPMSSIQYFYKVLNTPALVNELRDIAIKEFSVENVLFWDNYQLLQKMVYRYQIEYEKAKEMNDERYITQYDFEGYYQQQMMSTQPTQSMDSYSYDPNMAIPKEIMPYFTSFYYTFIHYDGPAAVNLSGNTISQIQCDISIYPAVGIFDNAKNEVVEMMYTSIFPILLKNNKRHFDLSV